MRFDKVFGPTHMCILYTRYNGLRCSTGVRIEADRGSLGTCYMSLD